MSFFQAYLHRNPAAAFTKNEGNPIELLLDYFSLSSDDGFVEQDFVLTIMNLENFEKIQLTHAMKEAFPTVKTERKSIDGKQKTVYRELKKKIPFSLLENDLSTHETVVSLGWDINSEIAKL